MKQIALGALLILVGWIGPTLRLIFIPVTATSMLHLSINKVNSLCQSVLGQVAQSLSPAVGQYCSQATTGNVLAIVCIVAGGAVLLRGGSTRRAVGFWGAAPATADPLTVTKGGGPSTGKRVPHAHRVAKSSLSRGTS